MRLLRKTESPEADPGDKFMLAFGEELVTLLISSPVIAFREGF